MRCCRTGEPVLVVFVVDDVRAGSDLATVVIVSVAGFVASVFSSFLSDITTAGGDGGGTV